MKKQFLFLIAWLALATVFTWYGCQKEEILVPNDQNVELRTPGDSKVFPPTAQPYGKSYTEWTVEWFLEFMAFDCDHNPWLHPEYILFHESGPVYFMAGIKPPATTVNVTVPHGKAILFPFTNYINDYPCPSEWNFEPVPPQTLEEFLTEGIIGWTNGVTSLSATVDGDPITDPESYGFISSMFEFTGNLELLSCDPTFYDPCINGEVQQGVSGGYWLILKPLSKGTHTVHYHSDTWGFVQDGTFYITVE